MRKELYNEICNRLRCLYWTQDGTVVIIDDVEGNEIPEGVKRVFPYIDLWNHNVEFIEQEENW